MADPIQTAGAATALPGPRPRREAEAASDAAMREAARAFEATFLAEMLKHAGFGEVPEAFGGGTGEAQFAGLLREAHAHQLAEVGGVGLADQVFRSLVARQRDDG